MSQTCPEPDPGCFASCFGIHEVQHTKEKGFDKAKERLKDMEICEKDVLYLGNDMLNDITPAKKAGFTTALFAGDKRSLRLRKDHSECMHMKADMVITDLIQLLNHI